ncbi:terminase large subunit [Shewanella sp. phage 1/4]|uniref:terminase large subunit n=1 Tax=Shewanella phage 1/4 TaxID=1458859 RepID=UPI0004F882E1|nr:terminase large subunit [Shewanella sp. phage 1/4]AHK11204.1 terminase large subunit [Shewanella sp. phage 1/4]
MSEKTLFSPASPKQALMLKRASDTQIVVIGGAAGSGKSHILNHLPLLVVDDPRTNCIMYRRTNPQLEGGLWPNGRKIWAEMPDWVPKEYKPKNIREKVKEVILYNGAKIKYNQAENTSRAKDDAQGQEFTLVCIDEATQHDWEFIEYLMSRLRSPSKHFSRMVMSCNPDPDHKLRQIIDWYLDEEGYPDPDKDGVQRYFITLDGEFQWGNTKAELGERFDIPEKDWESKILSFAFVSGTIYDNPPMMVLNPQYLAFLEGLNDIDKAQLLHGYLVAASFVMECR